MNRTIILLAMAICWACVTTSLAVGSILVGPENQALNPVLMAAFAEAGNSGVEVGRRFDGEPRIDGAVPAPAAAFGFEALAQPEIENPIVATTATVSRDDVLSVILSLGQLNTDSDFNSDGTVGIADLAHVSMATLTPEQGAPVVTPEPSGLVVWLALIAVLAIIASRRCRPGLFRRAQFA
jgi:hypothetical protein